MATHRERIRQTHERGESEVEFARVLAFTDGVFAIAITLLVLALEVPAGVDDVGAALRDRSSDFVAYGFSFAVLGSIWLAHHRFYGSVVRFNTRLIVLNLAGISLAFTAQVFYAFHNDMVEHDLRQYERRFLGPAAFVVSGTFLLSIPVAFVDPNICPFIWVGLLVFGGRIADAIGGRSGL